MTTKPEQPTAALPRRRPSAGDLLRAWRTKRMLSQLALSLETGMSARHLSFVETGRSRPSAELVLKLAETLQVPLRERNELLVAAGHAPRYPQRGLTSPELAGAHRAIERLLSAHDPYPGVAVDRYWNICLMNKASQRMVAMLPEFLTRPTVNMFRAGLHPEGFAAITTNFDDWGEYLVGELERVASSTFDETANALLEEVRGYPGVHALRRTPARELSLEERMLVPCNLSIGGVQLSLITTLVTFGSPREVTLSELTVELFYPAGEATAETLRAMA